jgi:hypothetical protein
MNSKHNGVTPTERKSQPDFMGIFMQAAKIVWSNRFLLWFGLLISLGSPGSFNFSPSGNDFSGNDAAKNYMSNHWQIFIAATIVALAIGILFLVLSLIAKAGLIKSVNLVTINKKTNFRKEWKEGKKYLWNLFKQFIIFLLAGIILLLVLAIPVIYLVANQLWLWALLIGLLAIAILIPIIFVLAFTNIFAQFYIVLSDLPTWSAIETGYNLLIKNLSNSIIFALLFLVVDILLGIIMLPIAGITLVILVPAGFLFYALNKIVFGFYLAFAIMAALAILLFFAAIFNAFKTTAWTLFFKELAKPKKEETEPVSEKETPEEIAATPASPRISSQIQLEEESPDKPENV